MVDRDAIEATYNNLNWTSVISLQLQENPIEDSPIASDMIECLTELADANMAEQEPASRMVFDPETFKQMNPAPSLREFELGEEFLKALGVMGSKVRANFRQRAEA